MNNYSLVQTTKFKKDLKLAKKRGYDLSSLEEIVDILIAGETLHKKHKNHNLSGDYIGCLECHIKLDWLLIYSIDLDEKILYLLRTGTHSDLF